jgi:hypothetical protein
MTDHRVIPKLQQDSPFNGLEIAETRLGLEGVDAPVSLEDGIPRTRIRPAVERDLRSPVGRRREASASSFNEPDLRDVAHRITGRVQTEARYETDRRAEATQLLDPEFLELAALESPDLAARHADRSAEVILAQADRDPR